MADTTSVSVSSQSDSSVAAGYTPKYRGIYILTPSGIQTHLLDYVEYLNGSERVEKIDIDKDGDGDYLYTMNGVLYVKYSTLQEPQKVRENEIKVVRLDTGILPSPYVPNAFHEQVHILGRLSVTFSPARSTDREWRMEFYDRYTEDDSIDLGTHDASLAPKHIVDIVSLESSAKTSQEYVVPRSLDRVNNPAGFILSSPKIDFFTGSVTFTLV